MTSRKLPERQSARNGVQRPVVSALDVEALIQEMDAYFARHAPEVWWTAHRDAAPLADRLRPRNQGTCLR